jgi:hypothetical protein
VASVVEGFDDEAEVGAPVEEPSVEELVVDAGALSCSMYATCSGVRFTVRPVPYPTAAAEVGVAVVVAVVVCVSVSVSVWVWVWVWVTVAGSAVTVVGTVVVTVAVDGSVPDEVSVLDGAELPDVTVWVTVLGAAVIDNTGAHEADWAFRELPAEVSSASICCC